ncbi:MAG TPA: DUF721 domain-containing protein [Bryobacteraceae bacterium]|nr:DUF721 domain-containing protein [Bryobacteraceae bacterium]HOL72201.1 DUF721 domain-containing protein [Bryobacteraceae bacterium]HOQ47326.1 DUF721 domain-containing protein [Bryobacteraceae bacterium]HPQ16937.1 DUF721 domain-containing protein [Bryobacteraceae bacterium]HPU73889.1 DUF721 domain-containing protein [Bryobacteraceae bacterium]
MDRAGKLIRGLRLGAASLSPEELLRAVWPYAIGRRIAAHARLVSITRTEKGAHLVVEVEDAVWRSQLETLSGQILARLQEIAGEESAGSIEFRLGVPRRQPQRAEHPRSVPDEADRIEDPVLRRVYRASRKAAAGR